VSLRYLCDGPFAAKTGNRPILAFQAEYFNKKNALGICVLCHVLCVMQRSVRIDKSEAGSKLRFSLFCICPISAKSQVQFHDSLNFNAALKETLNETSFPAFSPALLRHDKSTNINMLS